MKKSKKYSFVLFAFLLIFSFTNAQKTKEKQFIQIESVVKNTMGEPIFNAKVFGKEGAIRVSSDKNGHFSIKVPIASDILIESDGYEPKMLSQSTIGSEIMLEATPFLRGNKDDVKIAFGSFKKADMLGAVSVLNVSDIVEFDNTSLSSIINGRVAGMFGSNNIRGLGDALVVLDGIPRYSRMSEVNLRVEEIDQITVLKDASAVALYGTQARNGVILITTKRGKANKKDINISAQFGLARPLALPQYLGSAEYMQLYNEARVNDGLSKIYDDATINNFKAGNSYRYPSVNYFSPEYIKPFSKYSNVLTEFSGGNDNTQYYANLGYASNGSLLNFGSGKEITSNNINIRANVNFKIDEFIKSTVDIAGLLQNNNSPSGDYFSSAASLKPNLYSPFIPTNLIRANNTELQNIVNASKNTIDDVYLLGGNAQNTTTPFSEVYAANPNQQVRNTIQFNNTITFDLRKITKGLSFKTNISYDFYSSYTKKVSKTYSVYQPVWSASEDTIIGLTQYGTDTRTGTENLSNPDFLRRNAFSGQFDYSRSFATVHNINATLLGYYGNIKVNQTLQPEKDAHLGLRIDYNFNKTYFAELTGAIVNSIKLSKENRVALSPAISLGWIISNENFLSSIKNIDYLKLKGSAGIINSDMSLVGFYNYDNVYANSDSYTWTDGLYTNYGVQSLRGASSSLGFEQRQELNIGFEGQFFNHSISIDANLFNTRINNQYVQEIANYPNYYSAFIPWSNYGNSEYKGAEVSVTYTKKLGDFNIDLGLNAMYWDSKVIEKSELYAFDYQYRKGKPVDTYFGLVSEGLFKDNAEIQGHAFQAFGETRPGDIKYKDQNGDGVIDNNDQVQIGRWNAPFTYGLNIKLTYKNISLFANGIGNVGSDAFLSGSYYRPDGDAKYSIIATERWTDATKETAKYPRLSSKTNSNNAQTSTFWMYKNDYFSLNRLQLTYDLAENICAKLAMKRLSIYLEGANLLLFSKQKDVRNLNIGTTPQCGYYSIGIRSLF
jgi:TonB-linked SusC/RagA family outer membrane protein